MNGTVRRACQAFRCARGAHPVEMKRAALPPPRPARRHRRPRRLRPRLLPHRSPGAADLLAILVMRCRLIARVAAIKTNLSPGARSAPRGARELLGAALRLPVAYRARCCVWGLPTQIQP